MSRDTTQCPTCNSEVGYSAKAGYAPLAVEEHEAYKELTRERDDLAEQLRTAREMLSADDDTPIAEAVVKYGALVAKGRCVCRFDAEGKIVDVCSVHSAERETIRLLRTTAILGWQAARALALTSGTTAVECLADAQLRHLKDLP